MDEGEWESGMWNVSLLEEVQSMSRENTLRLLYRIELACHIFKLHLGNLNTRAFAMENITVGIIFITVDRGYCITVE